MSYTFKRKEAIQTGLQRIALEQVDRALAETVDARLDTHEAVHQARKRCKKIRALLRVVRPVFESSYSDENAWYRDAARELAVLRDAQTVLETYLDLTQRFQAQLEPQTAATLTAWLTRRRDAAIAPPVDVGCQIEHFRERLLEGRGRIATWTLRKDGFDAVAAGLIKTYARGRRAMEAAYEDPSSERFHDWRKRVKYHWYHMRLLSTLHPPMLRAQRDQADRIGESLGAEHDLSVLRNVLAAAGADLDARTVQTVSALIDRRRGDLQRQARVPGALLFCEKPKQLRKRLRCYWDARWR